MYDPGLQLRKYKEMYNTTKENARTRISVRSMERHSPEVLGKLIHSKGGERNFPHWRKQIKASYASI